MASDTSVFIDANTGVFTPDYSRWRAVETFLQRPLLASATANLTNNTGGTPSTTLAAITQVDTVAASFASTQNSVTQLGNSVNGLLAANQNFIVAGTNMTSALSTFADGGGVTLTTAGASADSAILLANTNTGQSTWGTVKLNTNDRPGFGGVIKTGASIASVTLWAGLKLTDTPVVATDADQAFFRYEAGVDTNWQFVWSVAGEDYQFDTGIEVAASTSYSFWIYIAADRKPRLAIASGVKNPAELVPGMPSTQYMTADIDLKVFVGALAGAAAAKALTVRLLGASKDYND
jgi:hypothetical protein